MKRVLAILMLLISGIAAACSTGATPSLTLPSVAPASAAASMPAASAAASMPAASGAASMAPGSSTTP